MDLLTRLYNLEPIGLNTGMVERLTSYLTRLAEEHYVTLGTLVGKELALVLGKEYLINSSLNGGSRFYDTGSELNGYGKAADDCIKGLEALTGQTKLSQLTLLRWNTLFPWRGLLRTKKAWCTGCLSDWKEREQPIYEPLSWSVKPVQICTRHHLVLQTKCPHCNKEVPILSRRSRNGYCSNCNCWLGGQNQESTSVEVDPLVYFIAREIEELLCYSQYPDYLPMENCTNSFIKSVVDLVGGKNSFSRILNVPKTTVRVWYNGEYKPNLESVLQVCYVTNTKIVDLIKGQPNIVVVHRTGNKLSSSETQKREKFDKTKIEQLLKSVIEGKCLPPPSVAEVARNNKLNKRILYRYFSKLCKEISAKHSAYIQECKDKRIDNACQKIEKIMKELIKLGIYPSRRKMEELLSPDIKLREKPLYLRWKKIMRIFLPFP